LVERFQAAGEFVVQALVGKGLGVMDHRRPHVAQHFAGAT